MDKKLLGTYALIGVAVILLTVFIGYRLVNRSSGLLGAETPISARPSLGVNSTSTVTSTVKMIVSANSGAQLLVLSNTGAFDLYYSATTTNLAVGSGALLKGSTTQVFSAGSLWTGGFYGVSNGTTSIGVMAL